MAFELMEHQKEVVDQLGNGKILYGGVGSGKSIASLAYYLKHEKGKDIYVITTAKKRDSLDWEKDAARLGISTEAKHSIGGKLTVDSWNNIGKYIDHEDCFFIFDEQRLVGSGSWVRAFYRIAKRNRWILLSATPGDNWLDYAPVFVANGWYKNITHFKMEHVVYASHVRFPKVVRYIGVRKLERLRNEILVEMPYEKHTQRVLNYLTCGYDKELMEYAINMRWNVFTNTPMVDAAELYRVMRKIANTDPSRLEMVIELMKIHPKLIIFYNFDYELEILRTLASRVTVAEWNGHRKQLIPTDVDHWVYLVQYQSGAEGWNSTATDAMILYSLTYSYKNFHQAQGRIDRLNTSFTDLYYYVLTSDAQIDRAILNALKNKKSFNERREISKIASKW